MKKLGKILLVTLSILVSVILIEYIYSQRWRLQKSADVSEYEELIVGEWSAGHRKSNGVKKIDNIIFYKDFRYERPFYKNGLDEISSTWKIEKPNILLINKKIQSNIRSVATGEFSPPFVIPRKKEIFFLNKNYIVFNNPPDNYWRYIIPRKEVYYRIK